MIKANKWKVLLSSLIILLPVLFGLILWDVLPEQMATHWGINGEADGWSSRFWAVFAMPAITFITHWICIFVTGLDPKNKGQNKKVVGMIFWICPMVSLFASAVIYSTAFGKEFSMDLVQLIVIGLMFVLIGNYLPKCKHNYTIGIKVPWALHDEENWNATHRFGGRVWVVGGFLIMVSVFLPENAVPYAMIILLLLILIIPTAYSYLFYRNQMKEGKTAAIVRSKQETMLTKIGLIITGVILAAVAILLFSGNIEIHYDEESFTIEADYWHDKTIEYADIADIEYREKDSSGSRTNGFGSSRLLMGTFHNSEFGSYTRYSYTKCDSGVVVKYEDKILVLSGKDEESTKEIYNELLNHMVN